MNVHLTPELEQMIQAKVKSGSYNSASEVMREALRMMQNRDAVRDEIRAKIAAGAASLKAGRVYDGEAVFAKMFTELNDEILAEEAVTNIANGAMA